METALATGIRCFNVESTAELTRLNEVAGAHGVCAPVSLRVNPDVDANTHPYISTGLKENKFGVDVASARIAYRQAADSAHLDVQGIDCHIGSQLTDIAPFVDALDRVLELVEHIESEGITIRHIDLGGGLGVCYHNEHPPLPEQYVRPLLARLSNSGKEILIEPGRAIAANAGILVTELQYLKETTEHNFAIVDAAMNDLLRPSLYQAWQDIVPVIPHTGEAKRWDVVGPVCETGDFLGKEVRSAGAYGFTMASNYNSRPRPAEILVDGDRAYVIRERETVERLFEGEVVPDLFR